VKPVHRLPFVVYLYTPRMLRDEMFSVEDQNMPQYNQVTDRLQFLTALLLDHKAHLLVHPLKT
jgi:hypothetical protein